MAAQLTRSARDRLRVQVRREQDLAARVLAAEARLSAEILQRDAIPSAHDQVLAERRADVADAVLAYIDGADVGLDGAAIILGRSRSDLRRIVLERRLVGTPAPGSSQIPGADRGPYTPATSANTGVAQAR
jgi:hypothetical protein